MAFLASAAAPSTEIRAHPLAAPTIACSSRSAPSGRDAARAAIGNCKSVFFAGRAGGTASFRAAPIAFARLSIEAKKKPSEPDFDEDEWDAEKGLGTELTTGTWAEGLEALERELRIDPETKGAGRVVSSMKLTRQDLLQPGAVLKFKKLTTQVDIGIEDLGPPTTPVAVELEVQKVRADWFARGSVRTRMQLVCDRCACDYGRDVEAPWTMWITTKADLEELPDEEDAVMVMGPHVDAIDVSGVVRDTIYSSAPSRSLCTPDCKGLCQRCGADLNAGPCACKAEGDRPSPDEVPLQWAGLAELLQSGALDKAFEGEKKAEGKKRGRPRKRPLAPGNPDLN